MITKITFAIQCASIVMALILAHEYHDAKAANAAKLAAETKAAREDAWGLAHNPHFQKALLDKEIRELEPLIPTTALT